MIEQYLNKIIQGDCCEKLKLLPENSVDLTVTDPPYGYSFMGNNWDKSVPSVELWKECLRVLKPGGFAFVMSAPRQDVLSQMIVRIGEAGFDTDFTSLYWTYSSGFPKASNIGKMVDKRMGVEHPKNTLVSTNDSMTGVISTRHKMDVKSDQAKALDGSYGGFQPKPAVEVIIVAMKPLSEKTFVDQALTNGKGITWLDDCRMPYEDAQDAQDAQDAFISRPGAIFDNATHPETRNKEINVRGRFPANLLVSDGVLKENSKYFSLDAWAETLPFLHISKPSKSEKNRGCEEMDIKKANYKDFRPNSETTKGGDTPYAGTNSNGTMKNNHPTVKPLKLMSYLITLGSREGDTILEPFAGSGTTCVAAKELKRNYIGIEKESEYIKICEARLEDQQLALLS